MSHSGPGDGSYEMRAGSYILRLHARVFEVFSTRSSHATRYHVDTVGFAAREPDWQGRVKVQIGLLIDGELNLGAERTGLELEPAEWQRFQALVQQVKRVQAAGPEAW